MVKWKATATAAIFAAIICYGTYGHTEELQDVQVIRGTCKSESHVAEGQIGEDLTKKQSRFFCNTAVIAFFDATQTHVMIQFAQKESHHGQILGFAGNMESGGQILDVDHVYFAPGQATPVTEGFCKFFFTGKHMSAISCGAKVDEGQRRTVPVITFQALPGQ